MTHILTFDRHFLKKKGSVDKLETARVRYSQVKLQGWYCAVGRLCATMHLERTRRITQMTILYASATG